MNVELLKAKILDLAIHGKLVPQLDSEPAIGQIGEAPDEIPFEIPEKWKWVKIQDIAKINPKNKIEDLTPVSFIKMSAITQGYSDDFTQEIKLWKDVKKGFTHFAEGDVLVAKITPCFENIKSTIAINLKNGVGAGTTELHVLRATELVVSKFLLFFCKSPRFINDGVKSFTGTAGQQRISTPWIKNYQIPLPPIEEQCRIVAKINELFSILDAIDTKQKSLEEKLKLIKNKALDLAIHGKLVPQLDSEPAVEQIGKVPDEIPFKIPEKWKWVELHSIGAFFSGKTPNKELLSNATGIPYFKVSDMNTPGNEIYLTKTQLFVNPKAKIKQYPPASIVFPKNGGALLTNKKRILNQYSIVDLNTGGFVPNQDFTLRYAFIYFLLIDFKKIYKGSALPTLDMQKLKFYSIALPPLEEQHRIVAKINEIFSFCDKAMEPLHK